jgi:hypothetical protein
VIVTVCAPSLIQRCSLADEGRSAVLRALAPETPAWSAEQIFIAFNMYYRRYYGYPNEDVQNAFLILFLIDSLFAYAFRQITHLFDTPLGIPIGTSDLPVVLLRYSQGVPRPFPLTEFFLSSSPRWRPRSHSGRYVLSDPSLCRMSALTLAASRSRYG